MTKQSTTVVTSKKELASYLVGLAVVIFLAFMLNKTILFSILNQVSPINKYQISDALGNNYNRIKLHGMVLEKKLENEGYSEEEACKMAIDDITTCEWEYANEIATKHPHATVAEFNKYQKMGQSLLF